jgi:hypothetical protein
MVEKHFNNNITPGRSRGGSLVINISVSVIKLATVVKSYRKVAYPKLVVSLMSFALFVAVAPAQQLLIIDCYTRY